MPKNARRHEIDNIMQCHLSTQKFAHLQFCSASLIIVLGLLNYVLPEIYSSNHFFRTLDFFDVGEEISLPSWFSSVNLFVSSILVFLVYKCSENETALVHRYWLVLSGVFAYLSLDESAEIHERFNRFSSFTKNIFPVLETHSWVFFGTVLSILFVATFVPFLLRIHRRTAVMFIIAGAIFVSGSIGFEFIGAVMRYTGYAQSTDLIYKLRRIVEESLEIYGIVIFNCAVFRELSRRSPKILFV